MEMIPFCHVCNKRHYGDDCPKPASVTEAMIEQFQRERSEWFSAPILEIIGEYETWRAARPSPTEGGWQPIGWDMVDRGLAAWDWQQFYERPVAELITKEIIAAAARPKAPEESK